TDRAAGVGAGRAGAEPRRDRRRRAARAAARREWRAVAVIAPPGRRDRAERAGLVRGAHRKLVQVELAAHPRPGGEERGGDRRLVGRREAFEDAARGAGSRALRREQVLDAERHAGEWLELARCTRGVRGLGGSERMIRRLDQEGVERAPLLDRGDERLGHLARRKIARPHPVADRGNAKIGERGHSITFGTAKKPCSASGALASTWSRMPPSVTASSRRRSLLGTTAVIGSTPSTSTSASCSTQPRMLESSGASAATSSSLTAMRASFAIWRTVSVSTDMTDLFVPDRRDPATAASIPAAVRQAGALDPECKPMLTVSDDAPNRRRDRPRQPR